MRSTPMAAAKTERLLNLVIALLSTRRAMSRATIRERVAGYAGAPTDEAFERMFERDKDDLRELGIPVVTEDLDDLFADEPGYRIDRTRYALPDLELTPEQFSLLASAGRMWSQASMGQAAGRALRKVESVAPEDALEAGQPLDRIEAHVRTSDPAFEAVRQAVVAGRPVRFAYRGRSGDLQDRTVQPWGITGWHGHWYLTGFDTGREAPRVFRLDRIDGDVRNAGRPGSYEVPEDHDPRAAVADVMTPGDPVAARLRVRDGRAHALRRRATGAPATRPDTPGWDLLEVEGRGVESFADELVGYGADVVVDGPPELRSAVVERLGRVLRAHGGAR